MCKSIKYMYWVKKDLFGLVWKVWLYRRHSKRNQLIKITMTITTVLHYAMHAPSLKILTISFIRRFANAGVVWITGTRSRTRFATRSFWTADRFVTNDIGGVTLNLSTERSRYIDQTTICTTGDCFQKKIKNRRTHWANVVVKL